MMKVICSLSILTFFLPEATIASFPSRRVHQTLVSPYQDDAITRGTTMKHSLSSTLQNNASTSLSTGVQLKNPNFLARIAFIHRYRGFLAHDACADSIDGPSAHQTKITYNKSALIPALTMRGGASSNTVQNIVRSILDAPSLPTPIKQVIHMICKLVEDLTGWKILTHKGVVKMSKTGKMKSEEVLTDVVHSRKKNKAEKRKSGEVLTDVVHSRKKNKKSHQSKRRAAYSAGSEGRSCAPFHEDTATEEDSKTKATTSTKSNNISSNTNATPKPKSASNSKPPDAASKKFLSNNLKSSNPNYRIQRELKEFLSSPPPGLSVKISGKNVRLWIITLSMPDNTIYAGETYKLRVQFPNDYPTSPPSVYFLPPTPRHEHVYTNGDICLSLLGKDWRPIMTAQSLAQAIMSILCGAQRKSLPMDNSRHAGNKPGQRQDDWVYHDDNC
ncbi:hypothetical protein HJC23_003435 [Cyclotella cryptica]|uniref:UBC core domain-containing protein n=1 Tax=Cyclotella cryptica TaxID=29204 RepID=A0ABD3QYF0_9STRA|eukprot:CCRYP_002579-RA/>CCRYP_002579-RA protein AED:0.00 eAED:0.00 QI:159/-1/1/1/-1/1/1/196/443